MIERVEDVTTEDGTGFSPVQAILFLTYMLEGMKKYEVDLFIRGENLGMAVLGKKVPDARMFSSLIFPIIGDMVKPGPTNKEDENKEVH